MPLRSFVAILGTVLLVITPISVYAQHVHTITATLKEKTRAIAIQHDIAFHNSSEDTLTAIYLLDWNNASSHKNTPLAKRFAEEFDKSLHLAKDRDRGATKILFVSDSTFKPLHWKRQSQGDIVKLQLDAPLYPGKKIDLKLFYTITLPNSRFTSYGYTEKGDFNLRYWYMVPAVYHKKRWMLYSDKNLDDFFTAPAHYSIRFNYPESHVLSTDLDMVDIRQHSNYNQAVLTGMYRGDVSFFLEKQHSFKNYDTPYGTLISDIKSKTLSEDETLEAIARVTAFISDHLGEYPHSKLMVSTIDYKKNPLYGLNQLPSFIRPFTERFQYELKLLKTILNAQLDRTIYIDPRKDKWVTDAIQTYFMIVYKDTFYPEVKLSGTLSKVWLLRSFHLAKMDFNAQYSFLYMLMARKNIDQSLSTPGDSLIKFNEKIANAYKAGLGLKYINDYAGGHSVDSAIKRFYNTYVLKTTTAAHFKTILKEETPKDIDWFFKEYVATRHKIDFKIKKINILNEDSLSVTIKNKRDTDVPVSLFGIRNDTVVSKQWLTGITDEKTIRIARHSADRLVLNYNKVIPEFNQRNNWKSVKKGFLFYNKPLQFRFFKDAEDPFYNQIFYVPIATYNLYDGITPGMRLYNKSLIERPFLYDLRPSYAIREKALVGGASIRYRHYIDNRSLYIVSYGIRGSTFHYAENSRYSTITPGVTFGFRPPDFRSNEKKSIALRNINVFRDGVTDITTNPDYSVFNARYTYFNNDIIRYLSWFTDVQVSKDFSKLAFTIAYRKLFQNNRQLNLRLFAGKFIHNTTNSDFFSFALDRPTDYLFDYDYLGRSEDSGFYSQQIIIAEGGFKSKLSNPFANDWIVTANASINIWRWVELYGDIGGVKNTDRSTRFVYDAGIRLNLVTDYFELYFPFYSNNGWEIAQSDYSQKIRFIITLSPRTLTGLFTRKWF